MEFRLPEPSYADVSGDAVAWYSIGDGPETVVGSPGMFVSVESLVESPGAVRLLLHLSRFRRVVLFDHRTLGLSDTFTDTRDPNVADWVDDIRAVIDASGRSSVDLFGIGAAVMGAIAAAATLTDRISSLVLISGCPKLVAAPGYVEGMAPEVFAGWKDAVWGQQGASDVDSSYLGAGNEADRSYLRRAGRHGARPRAARRLLAALADADVRDQLELITCPTLVIHGEGDTFIPSGASRYIQAAIPSSKLELLPTIDHLVVLSLPDEVASLAGSFLTGRRVEPVPDRCLLAVLSTDIVDSTRRASAMGDGAWRAVIGKLEVASRALVEGAGGTIVKFTGDGHLATFDRPGAAVTTSVALSRLAKDLDVPIRTGIHFGEVEVLDGDILGLAVVMATRVMAVGDGGETIATSTVVELVEGSGHRWSSIGPHSLKGIERDRELFQLVQKSDHAEQPSAAPLR